MGCKELREAIDIYISKVDNDLELLLLAEGFAEAAETVMKILALEDAITVALDLELARFLVKAKMLAELDELSAWLTEEFPAIDTLDVDVAKAFVKEVETFVPKLTDVYLNASDPELYVETLSQRTVSWVHEWGEELGGIMKLNSHKTLEDILAKALEEGIGIREVTRRILDSGIRDTRWKARRVATTEILRAHSVSKWESMMQNPSCTHKTWLHSGEIGIVPRQNHVEMDGQTVPKAEPFTLTVAPKSKAGAMQTTLFSPDGGAICYPMYPRDTNLPPGESINCHCTFTPVSDETILALPIEERRRLQAEAIEEMDNDPEWKAYLANLDAKNRAKVGAFS